jgi:hypothetical protein
MRPSPLLLLALVAIGFALIAVPLARLTGAEGAWHGDDQASLTASSGEGNGDEVAAVVRVRFAHAPLRVVLTQDGRSVATFAAPADPATGQMDQTATLRLAAETPLDLLVEATWPDNTPATALGVEVEPDGRETRRATVWAEGAALTELLTFSWK